MSPSLFCPKCTAPLGDDAPAGLCPKCLLAAALPSDAAKGGTDPTIPLPSLGVGTFQPPTIEQLAKLFPQMELLELIGKGGMGAVYKARQPGLDRFVAVKILPPEVGRDPAFAERFMREARAMARLSHPNIVGVYDFGQTGGLYYFVMEYIDGANLRQTIQTGKLQPAEALAIVPQICDALQYAHDEGIVHRDIKPENILLDKRGRVKIADFGLSKLVHQDHKYDVSLTGTEQIMGTVRYMAPEQMLGTRFVDHRADIYSLGVVFYELLTGDVPMGRFAAPSKKVRIDVRLDEVVLRALEQEPENRYQHASDVKTDVELVSRRPVRQAQPRRPEAVDTTAAAAMVDIPSMALIVLSGLLLLGHGGGFLYGVMEDPPPLDRPIAFLGLGAITGAISLVGALAMRLLKMRGLAVVGAIAALVPVSPLSVVCIPVAIWALYVLNQPVVKEAFDKQAADDAEDDADEDVSGQLLLDETDYLARQLQLKVVPFASMFLVGGIVAYYLLPIFSLLFLWPVALGFIAMGLLLHIVAGQTTRRWDITYRKHRIRFDNSELPSGRLFIDKELVATGLSDLNSLLRGQIAKGDGSGDVIVARTNAGLLSFRLRLYAQPASAAGAVAPIVYSRREAPAPSFAEPLVATAANPISEARAINAPAKSVEPQSELQPWELHWRESPTFVRRGVEIFLGLVYLAGLICFFSFTVSNSMENGNTTATVRVGQPGPWLESQTSDSGFHTYFKFVSWSILVGIVAVSALQLSRRLEQAEKGKAHWIGWHYGVWTAMFCMVIGIALFNQYAGRLRPKVAIESSTENVTYFTGHSQQVKALALSADETKLVSAGADGNVITRNLQTGTVESRFTTPLAKSEPDRAALFSLALSPTAPVIVAGGNTGVWHSLMGDTQPPQLQIPTNGAVRFLAFYDKGSKLAYITNADTEVIFQDLQNDKNLGSHKLYENKMFGNIRAVTASPSGRFIALTYCDMVPSQDGGFQSAEPCKLVVLEAENLGREEFSWQFQDYAEFSFSQIAFLDNDTLACCIASGEMTFIEVRTADQSKLDHKIRISPGRYTAAAAARDGKTIFLAESKQICEIDVQTGQAVAYINLNIGEKLGKYSAQEIEALLATGKPHQVAAALWDGKVAITNCWPLEGKAEAKVPAVSE